MKICEHYDRKYQRVGSNDLEKENQLKMRESKERERERFVAFLHKIMIL